MVRKKLKVKWIIFMKNVIKYWIICNKKYGSGNSSSRIVLLMYDFWMKVIYS